MIYKNMINELSNSRMIKLINEEKLFWYQVNHPDYYKKLESLTYEELIEGKIKAQMGFFI